MKILGIKKNTSTSSILKELISPFIDLFSFNSREFFSKNKFIKSVPALCLVFAYLVPGLPRPAIRNFFIL